MKNFRKATGLVSPKIFSLKNTPRLIIYGILTITAIIINLLSAYLLSKVVDMVMNKKEETDLFGIKEIQLSLTGVIGLYVTAMILSRASQTARRLTTNPIISEAAFGLNFKLNRHLLALPYSYFTKEPIGKMSENFTAGSLGASDFTTQLLNQLIPVSLESLTAISLASYRYGLYPGLTFGSMFTVYALYNVATGHYIAVNQKELLKTKKEMTNAITNTLLNYDTIQYFNNVSYELEKVDGKLKQVAVLNTSSFSIPDKISFGQWFIIGGGFLGLMVLTDSIPPYELVAINFYLLQFINLFNGFGDGLSKGRAAILSLAEVAKVFEIAPKNVDDATMSALEIKPNNPPTISFNNIAFAYDDKTSIFENLSFSIEAGKTLGIVGLSGSGKSTLVKLLYRLYDVSEGSIKINGRDIKTLSLSSVRSQIAIVPQIPTVFNDSLKNNIWYGAVSKRGKNFDMNLLSDAIKKAALNDYITSLKDGINTSVGERALKISGGQLQRLAIARALLKEPSILIFDEATSALDSKTEAEIQESFKEITQGKTVIIISHKLYNVKNADRIIVLSQGKKIEEGNHDELLSNHNGTYASLWEKQSKEYQLRQLLEKTQVELKNEENQHKIKKQETTLPKVYSQDNKSLYFQPDTNNNAHGSGVFPRQELKIFIEGKEDMERNRYDDYDDESKPFIPRGSGING
jgi:ABC-type multidrug transport system fused ATPase/permease subunit